jgi:predicted dehydrogenase
MNPRDHEPLLISVLGTGRMAALHIRALQRLAVEGIPTGGRTIVPRVLLFGRNPEKLAGLAQAYPVVTETTTRLEEATGRDDVQAVDNCLTNALHYGPLMSAVQAGKHAFTDKPLGMTLEESERLLAAAERAGVTHGIIQNMRFQPGPVAARRLLAEGRLGAVFHARVTFGYFVPRETTNRPSWFYRRAEAGGGIVHDMMAHFFDLWESLFGPVRAVHCFQRTCMPERLDEAGRPFAVDVEDAAAVNLMFGSGVIAQCFISWVRRAYQPVPQFEIDGSEGSVVFDLQALRLQAGGSALFRYDPTRKQDPVLDDWEVQPVEPADPFEIQLREFIEAIGAGRQPIPNWRHAVRTTRLIEAAYESAAHDRVVPVEAVPV